MRLRLSRHLEVLGPLTLSSAAGAAEYSDFVSTSRFVPDREEQSNSFEFDNFFRVEKSTARPAPVGSKRRTVLQRVRECARARLPLHNSLGDMIRRIDDRSAKTLAGQ